MPERAGSCSRTVYGSKRCVGKRLPEPRTACVTSSKQREEPLSCARVPWDRCRKHQAEVTG